MSSRAGSARAGRALVVWSTVTAGLATGAVVTPAAWSSAGSDDVATRFADLLVAGCAAALLLALAWLWLVTTITVIELLTGRVRAGGGTTRRLVLLACGAAVLAGAAAPAGAAGDGSSVLAGLSLPDRTVTTTEVLRRSAPAEREPRSASTRPAPQPEMHVVRPGESLWSIARTTSTTADVDRRWRAIWAANRDLIGDDPDLILPGQHLRLPDADHDTEGDGR